VAFCGPRRVAIDGYFRVQVGARVLSEGPWPSCPSAPAGKDCRDGVLDDLTLPATRAAGTVPAGGQVPSSGDAGHVVADRANTRSHIVE